MQFLRVTLASRHPLSRRSPFSAGRYAGPAQPRPVTVLLLLSRKPATPAYVRLCQGENRDKRRHAAMQLRDTRSGAPDTGVRR